MKNEDLFNSKVTEFLNKLNIEEIIMLRKLIMSKKWQEYLIARVNNIQL